MKLNHEIVEKNVGLMAIFIVIAISFGGVAEIVPLIFQQETTEPVEGLEPYTALQMEGRDVYIREVCQLSQPDDPSIPCRNRALWSLLCRR